MDGIDVYLLFRTSTTEVVDTFKCYYDTKVLFPKIMSRLITKKNTWMKTKHEKQMFLLLFTTHLMFTKCPNSRSEPKSKLRQGGTSRDNSKILWGRESNIGVNSSPYLLKQLDHVNNWGVNSSPFLSIHILFFSNYQS